MIKFEFFNEAARLKAIADAKEAAANKLGQMLETGIWKTEGDQVLLLNQKQIKRRQTEVKRLEANLKK